MRQRRFLPLLALTTTFAVATVLATLAHAPFVLHPMLASSTRPATPRTSYDPSLVRETLEFYAQQTKYDPQNPVFRSSLARWYLESYRETGDNDDARRAEQAARASLAISTHNNSAAYFQLSRSLLAQHRFAQGLTMARRASLYDPTGYRECADIEMELGDYNAAKRDIAKSVPQKGADPAYLALVARVKELHGDTASQLNLLSRAALQADANRDMPPQSVAWFHERLGHCLMMMGHLDEAKQSYEAGLSVFPRDYRSMAALAHLEANSGHWGEAIKWGDKAAAIVPSPEYLALLGDAYKAQGNLAAARRQFQLVETIGNLARAQGAVYDRQRALFYADHNLKPSEAVELARGELLARHDIYAYDTLAWTLYKAGQLDAAQVAMKKALTQGTKDASLFYHAGMIAAAQHQNAQARSYLQSALSVNPRFDPSQPVTAKAVLSRLGTHISTRQ